MKLGIMQPYFFPYLGYFDLINRVDSWVVFDVVQYQDRSWMNRNRILHPARGWQYISLPVRHVTGQSIKGVILVDKLAARARILGQVDHYRPGGAPFFKEVRALIAQAFDMSSGSSLRDLNVASLAVACDYLGIKFAPTNCSDELPELRGAPHAGAWALEISAALGATEYINPLGGADIFDPAAFRERGIELSFVDVPNFSYQCPGYEFTPGLSIIDVMMWNDRQTIGEYLQRRKHAHANGHSALATSRI